MISTGATLEPEDETVYEDETMTAENIGIAAGPKESLSHRLWWRQRQLEAWKIYESIPMPSRKDEDWRFTTLSEVVVSGYHDRALESALEKEIVRRSKGAGRFAAKLIFGNNARIDEEKLPDELAQKGVIWEAIDAAIENHPEILKKYFMTRAVRINANKFSALHAAFCRSGSLLYVPRGVEVKLPFEAFHWLGGRDCAVFPHTLVILEENASVVMVDYFQSVNAEADGFCSGVLEFFLGRGSSLRYIAVQNWGKNVRHFLTSDSEIEDDATSRSLMVMLGARYARHNVNSHLVGPGAFSEMLGLHAAVDGQQYDQRTYQDHKTPRTKSDLLYKGSLADTARAIFSGMIRVEPGAIQTDAYQANRSLMLSDTAEADTLPGLEILTDDVRCTHGATAGSIDEDELFYMRTRGIPENAATQLMVFGFYEDVLQRMPLEGVNEYLRELIRQKLADIAGKAQ